MAATSEEGRPDPSPSSEDSTTGDGRGGETQQALSTGDGKAPEKTISCVSCRKRKLKCDRIKPKCGTCNRLRHECEYPERRRTVGSKRRNMKELEARLAQVETQLVAESKMSAATNTTSGSNNMEPDWNTLGMNYEYADEPLFTPGMEMPQLGYGFQEPGFSQELLSLGLQEPLPPQDMMDELHQIYFDIYHPQLPMIHKFRYYASLDRAPHMRPPICLRYAMWTMAASLSDKYKAYEDILYERARKYIEAAEMKGHGEQFISVYHVQTWSLIGTFEAKKTYFSRAWVSVGRMTRVAQMLGLYRLDGDVPGARKIIPPSRDWIEHEERRRTFWAAYYGDRWASSGTGWPMIIDERDIQTNLPASEEAFERGVMEPTITLEEGLTVEGAPKLSSFAGVILSAALFGHNYVHLHRRGPNENPGDVANGEFWKRHRQMENVLSNIFMFLPQQLRLPGGIRDINVIFLHMNIHASTICLQQAAVNTGERYNLDAAFVRQLHARSLMAAEEISNVMRLASYVDVTKMNSWSGFCLYVAGGIFIKDQKMPDPQPQSASNLEFILAAMRAIGKKHSVTDHFTAQLELDIEVANLGEKISPITYCSDIPNTPMNGLLASRNGLPMTTDNLQSFLSTNNLPPENCPFAAKVFMDSTVQLGPSSSNVAALSPGQFFPESTSVTGSVPIHRTVNSTVQTTDPHHEKEISDDTNLEIAVEARPWAGDTPSTDTSSSNTRQYPYRPTDPSNFGKTMVNGIFLSDMMRSSTSPPGWVMQEEFSSMSNMDSLHPNDGFDEFLANAPWAQEPRQD